MQFAWGSYLFPSNAVECASDVETLLTQSGDPHAQKHTFRLQGELLAEGQAAISAAMIALKAALAVPYQDLVLLHDDGSQSATILLNAGSLSGVICTVGPGFPLSSGGEYVNQRTFTATFTAEYPFGNTEGYILAFSETLRFSGGGPLNTVEPCVSGDPVEFTIYARTPYFVTQAGSATGYRLYPTVPGPIWPKYLLQSPTISPVSPQKRPGGYQGYQVSWEYQFGSAKPLVGVPTVQL